MINQVTGNMAFPKAKKARVDTSRRGTPVIPDTLQALLATGEDSRRQFKRNITNTDALAAEMAAFANAEGGHALSRCGR